jgi:hypothetical protein
VAAVLTIVAIMVMTAAAGRLGVLDCVAETVFRRASLSIGVCTSWFFS